MEKSLTEFLMAQNPLSRPFYLSELATAMTTLAPPTPHIHPALLHWAKMLRQQRDLTHSHHHLLPVTQHVPLALTTTQSAPSFPSGTHSPKKASTSAFSPILSPKSPGEFYFYPQTTHLEHLEHPIGTALHPQDLRLQLKLHQLLHSPAPYAKYYESHQHGGNGHSGKSAPNSPRYTRSSSSPPLSDVDGLLDLSIKSTNTTPRKSPQGPLSPTDFVSPTGRKRTLQETLDLSTHQITSSPSTQRIDKQNTDITPLGDTTKKSLPKSPKKTKAVRRLQFDEDKSSPVSGTIIRDIKDALQDAQAKDAQSKYEVTALGIQVTRRGDIDPIYNTVEVTEESRAEISRIENKIGAYVCRLCADEFEDAFGLARHRCACIVHVEYRCPECEKVFSCPANLASHRRWHRPRNGVPSLKTEGSGGTGKRSPLKHKNKTCAETTTESETLPRSRREWDLTSPHSDTSSLSTNFQSSPDDKNNNSQGMEGATSSFLSNQTRLTECVICRKSFPHPQTLQAHLATHLSPMRPSPLSLLNAGSMKSPHPLSPNHLSPMSPLSPESYSSSSSTLEKPLFDVSNLLYVKQEMSEEERVSANQESFPCPYKCATSFGDLTGLANHLRIFHNGRQMSSLSGLLQTVTQNT